MITPSFSLTATERVLPKLALDFTTASLDPRITFTRAGDTATVVNSTGLIEGVLANTPRFDYDPITLVCKGLLIEEARTNLLLNSNDFTSTWVNSGTVTANNAISPDGTLNAAKFEGGVSYQDVVKAASAITYTTSLYFKQGSGNLTLRLSDGLVANYAQVVFNLATGVISTAASVLGNFTNASATISSAGGDYYRVTLTCTSNTVTTIRTRYAFTGTGNYTWLYGAQLEAGAFATSYIPTTTTALTRNADVATMTGTNFSSWFNASEGTFVANFVARVSTSGPTGVFSANNSSSSYAIDNRVQSGYVFGRVADGGVNQCFINMGAVTTSQTVSSVLAYKANDFIAARNGASPVTDTSGTVPTLPNRMLLGGIDNNAFPLNSHLVALRFYPQHLTSDEVQSFST